MKKLVKPFVLLWIILSISVSCSSNFKKDVKIPMSDGVNLAANISLPDNSKKNPVILVRTPYGKDNGEDGWGAYWAKNGFAFVIQDCRGTGNSEGEWYPALNEKKDGIDTRSWILQQPWCDGNIGTTGGSYLGYTQFISSTESNESLKAMFPIIPLMDWYKGAIYIDGTLSIGTAMGWGLEMASPSNGGGALIDEETWDWDTVYKKLPLINFDENVGKKLPWMRDWVTNPVANDYWKKLSLADLKEKCKTPLITVSGWYDILVHQALEYHSHAIGKGKKHQHLIVGPWAHSLNYVPGERKMTENHVLDFEKLEISWFNYWLKGKGPNVKLPPVKLYVMGKNYWRDENEWPLERTNYVNYYFHSAGNANTLDGDGSLSRQKSAEELSDHFVYDPDHPVPTHGGALLFGEPGIHDQSEIENRKDVLVYTSKVLEQELEVTGPVKVILYASTDARDTDWTAKLLDVYPDGKAFNLCDGVIRARFHKDPLQPELIKPDQIYRYEIDLWATSNVFLPGHLIRIEISSSNFPRFDRNPNTGNEFGMDAEMITAKQTVYHNSKYPSHVILPVIPKSD